MDSNIYHRYLDLPFDYQKPEIFESGHHEYFKFSSLDVIDPRFKSLMQSLGLEICPMLEAFYTAPGGGTIPIHTDTCYIPGFNDICKLNITWGPKESVTQWFKAKDPSKLCLVDDQVLQAVADCNLPEFHWNQAIQSAAKIYTADRRHVDLVHQAVIDRPSLINISQLHSTYNPGADHRWSLCHTLYKNGNLLTFRQALKIFKEYIIDTPSDLTAHEI